MVLDYDVKIEYLCLNVCLSPRMHFRIMVLYNPPACDSSFYDNLDKLLKTIAHKSEVLIFGDFNIDWLDKSKRRKLKTLMTKFDFIQTIKGATRITKSSRSQIDLIFSNREERITKSYNLLTGLSDHNMILTSRKLTKKRFPTQSQTKIRALTILKNESLKALEGELNKI